MQSQQIAQGLDMNVKQNGANTDPRGTPNLMEAYRGMGGLRYTNDPLSKMKEGKQLRSLTDNPYQCWKMFRGTPWSMVLKAVVRSNRTSNAYIRESNTLKRSSTT